MKNAAMNIIAHDFVWMYVFYCVGHILSSEIAGSYGSSVQLLEELPNCFSKASFYISTRTRVLIFLHPHEHLLSIFFIIAILVV